MRKPSMIPVIVAAMILLQPGPAFGQTPPRESVLKARVTGLWLMGQSLCEGSESLPVVTSVDTGWGNYAFRRGVRTWMQGDHGAQPEQRKMDEFTFVPLIAGANGGLGETIANGLADHLKSTLFHSRSTPARDTTPHFLVSYAGQGGTTIEELSPADETTDPRTPAVKQHGGGYFKTSLDDARRAKEQARSQGQDFQVAALIWMQGEANGGPTGGIIPSRWKEELPRQAGQEWYRDRLLAYRQRWSDDLRAITGQAQEIPMFTYQTLGPAGEAQLLAADRDPQVIMVGPHYMVPSALNSRRVADSGAAIHLSADGQRWYGEQVAKVVRRVLVDGERWQPLRPLKAWVDPSRTAVLVEYAVPRPPLVIDERFLPREQTETNGGFSSLCGFQVRHSSVVVPPITAVEIESPTRVRLRLGAPLPVRPGYTINYGLPFAGKIGTIAEVRSRSAAGNQPMTELRLDGAWPERLKPLLAEGAFYVANTVAGPGFAEAPVRFVDQDHGSTILAFENRERRNNVDFLAGQTVTALRPFLYGNVRDSDPETALYSFGDNTYGTRAGQPYPLWNWSVHFSGFPVSEL